MNQQPNLFGIETPQEPHQLTLSRDAVLPPVHEQDKTTEPAPTQPTAPDGQPWTIDRVKAARPAVIVERNGTIYEGLVTGRNKGTTAKIKYFYNMKWEDVGCNWDTVLYLVTSGKPLRVHV